MFQKEFVSREYDSEGVCFRSSLFQKEDQVRVDLHKEKLEDS